MRKTMSKRMTIMLISVGCVFAAIVGYQLFVASMMKQFLSANAQPPATVTAVQVERQLWQPRLASVGSLRAVQGVDISAEVSGMVKEIHFKSGDEVQQGDLLLELNSAEEMAHLQALTASRKLAEINHKRNQQQFKIHAISQAQLDASQAELASRRAQESQQQAVIDKKHIRAPFSGRLGVSRISQGQFINPAEPIVSLQNSRSLYVDFNLPQKFIPLLEPGQGISVSRAQDETAEVAGTISAINAAVDSSTRNVRIEGRIDNRDGMLLPGMFVNVRINSGEPQRLLTLPQTAISYNAYGSTLFVARAEKGAEQPDSQPRLLAQQVFVKTGEKRGDQVAILEGIEEGDTVVTSGQLKLKNGTPLIINNAVLPANEAAPKPEER
ncbi:membrane fusion protein, multidrug efflux system [Mariprofundus ferrinatatus]|uniref:Membrane fusion protein, multidrug efflux system n=2 Tax=Mariprofundus ferrinatatus TaxID=1921087 RepID=A0A2K8L165_9PROT|nr:membrane fusion protein, multidrug efflux system [Mariprofundus ferrinatatus]